MTGRSQEAANGLQCTGQGQQRRIWLGKPRVPQFRGSAIEMSPHLDKQIVCSKLNWGIWKLIYAVRLAAIRELNSACLLHKHFPIRTGRMRGLTQCQSHTPWTFRRASCCGKKEPTLNEKVTGPFGRLWQDWSRACLTVCRMSVHTRVWTLKIRRSGRSCAELESKKYWRWAKKITSGPQDWKSL